MFHKFDLPEMNNSKNHIDLIRDYDNPDCNDYDIDYNDEPIDPSRVLTIVLRSNSESEPPVEKLDSVVSAVIHKFKKRAKVGKSKYGTDLDRNDLTFLEWIKHAQEEHMDAILYLEKIKQVEETRLASAASESTVYLYVAIYMLALLCIILYLNILFA